MKAYILFNTYFKSNKDREVGGNINISVIFYTIVYLL